MTMFSSHASQSVTPDESRLGGTETDLPFGVRQLIARPPWRVVMAAYSLYVLLTFLNDVTATDRQHVVALLFLGFMAVHAGPRLLCIPFSKLTVALLLAALVPVVAWLAGITGKEVVSTAYAIKYFALLFVIWTTEVLCLPPLYSVRERWWGMGSLLAIMLFSLAAGLPTDRFEGWFFKNPNNFALVATSLLFFVDHERDSRRFMIAIHAFVAALILLSGTAGALLAYLVGLGTVLIRSKGGRRVCLTAALVVAFALPFGLLSQVQSPDQTSMLGSIWSKWSLTHEYYADLNASADINFWEIGQQHGGAELTSALWRLWHWNEILRIYQESGWGAKMLGHGLGISTPVIGNLPHNDYLRLLFEVGVVGLLSNLVIWVILFRRADPAVRGPAIMMAVYAITENNFDNFLVMSLFALFMVSARREVVPPPSPFSPEPAF
ncbi:MAG: O-antigen ligase family protein [Pontiellaceae bacterium]|jgi:hypothetical protein|nr:O-antigen ligase family protein [Pontiellaceae bacterium]